jgi:hypothetical protein
MRPFIFSLLLILIVVSSFAGDVKGNGGGAVICSGNTLEILDLYEARLAGYGEPSLGNNTELESMMNEYLQRLSIYSPVRAKLYLDWFKNFENESIFLSGIPIQPIPDLGSPLPKGCVWHQIVNQNPLLLPSDKKYLIDKTVWQKLSNLQKVGLIFHELIYRESNSSTSRGLRLLNGLVMTDQLNSLGLEDRINLFSDAGLLSFEAQGLKFLLHKQFKVEKGSLLYAWPEKGSTFSWKGQNLNLANEPVIFYQNSKIKSLPLSGKMLLTFKGQILEIERNEYSLTPIFFHPNGEFQAGELSNSKKWIYNWGNLNVSFNQIELWPSGKIATLQNAFGKIQVQGKYYPVSGSEIRFYDNEQIRSLYWGDDPIINLDSQKIYVENLSLLTFNRTGQIANFVSDRPGRIKNYRGQWIDFAKGDLVQLELPDE